MQQVGVAKAREKAILELKENDIAEVMGEENLLLGRYGKKDELNTADDYYNGVAIPIKKVSGSDVLPDNEEFSTISAMNTKTFQNFRYDKLTKK
jgi:hypothetical protein